MKRWRKIGLGVACILTVTVALLFSLNLILTRTTLLEPLKEKLLKKLCENTACQASFEKLEVLLLPSPHVVASGMQITIPGMLSGTVKSLSLYPRIAPLFAGRVELARLRLTSPRMEITVPDVSDIRGTGGAAGENPAQEGSDTDALAQHSGPSTQHYPLTDEGQQQASAAASLTTRLFSLLNAIAEKAPGLRLEIDQGTIDIISKRLSKNTFDDADNHRIPPSRGDKGGCQGSDSIQTPPPTPPQGGNFQTASKTHSRVSLQDLTAAISLPPDHLSMKIECKSDRWEKLVFDGWFNPREAKGQGRIALDQFQSQMVAEYLPPGVPKPVDESPIHFEASFSSESPDSLSASFRGSSSSLSLQLGHKKSVIKNASFEGTLDLAGGKLEIGVSKLDAEYPQLSLTGQFAIDPEVPEAGYRIECRDTDAASVRDVALALVGEEPVAQDIFEIIRGGKVPLVIFQARGPSPATLRDADQLSVTGSIRNGEVFIPKVKLQVNDVNGDVLIAHGILEGKNLQGRANGSTARNGSLTVALTEDDGPFHLDLEIDADLAQLPPVLARVVDNEAFLKELALMSDITGKANGRLILGDTLNAIRSRVEVNECSVQGRYQRLPLPLELRTRSLAYEGDTVTVGSLAGRLGKSEWSEVSGSFDWSRGPKLELAAASRGRIALDELVPWLMSSQGTSENRWRLQALEGTLGVDSLAFKGLLTRPENWRFLLKARLENVVSRSDLYPYPLSVKTGTLNATWDSLQLANCDLTYGDASLVASGKLNGYLTALQSADFTFQGTIGPQTNEWVSDLIRLPSDLRVRAPLATPRAHLVWERSAHTALSGVFRPTGGPEVAIDLDHGAEGLVINQLTVKDEESDAAAAITVKGDELHCEFKGNLASATLDRLFAKDRLFGGSVAGDLAISLIPSRLAGSKADGKLTLKDVWVADPPGKPLRVDSASIEAKGSMLEVKQATLRVEDTPLELRGRASIGDNELQLDLDLSADRLDWNQLQSNYPLEKLGRDAQVSTDQRGVKFREIPVAGILRVHLDSFTYDNYTWKPFSASVTFARDGISIELTEANLCTIPTPARIIPSSHGQLLIISPTGRDLDLDRTLSCLWDKKGVITGALDLKGEISAMVRQENMSETFEGSLDLMARAGRVYHSTVLAKIFDLLNITEIYRGRLPDLAHDGCAYDSIQANITLKNGKLMVKDAIFDGRCAKMVWTGEIDLKSQTMNFIVLVSPLKTVDTLIDHIPLLGGLLGGTLISIPVKVAGDLTNPSVVPLSPSAVGSELVGTMKRIFKLPLKLIQPLQ